MYDEVETTGYANSKLALGQEVFGGIRAEYRYGNRCGDPADSASDVEGACLVEVVWVFVQGQEVAAVESGMAYLGYVAVED